MKSKSKQSKLNKENIKTTKSDFQNLKKISIDELNKENELQYVIDDDLNDNKKEFQSIEDNDITLDAEKHVLKLSKQVLNSFLTSRIISKAEACFELLKLELYWCTESFCHIRTSRAIKLMKEKTYALFL